MHNSQPTQLLNREGYAAIVAGFECGVWVAVPDVNEALAEHDETRRVAPTRARTVWMWRVPAQCSAGTSRARQNCERLCCVSPIHRLNFSAAALDAHKTLAHRALFAVETLPLERHGAPGAGRVDVNAILESGRAPHLADAPQPSLP